MIKKLKINFFGDRLWVLGIRLKIDLKYKNKFLGEEMVLV
jgi:hypothetical protein